MTGRPRHRSPLQAHDALAHPPNVVWSVTDGVTVEAVAHGQVGASVTGMAGKETVVARFAFRFHPLYRILGVPFGVVEGTTSVEVADGHLTVQFGPWRLRTPLSNVVGCDPTGPFTVAKTAGPAHLSLADRGITFATNPEAGLCLRFAEPVPAIDPFGWIRHPAATVTVDQPGDLAREVLAARPRSPRGGPNGPTGAAGASSS